MVIILKMFGVNDVKKVKLTKEFRRSNEDIIYIFELLKRKYKENNLLQDMFLESLAYKLKTDPNLLDDSLLECISEGKNFDEFLKEITKHRKKYKNNMKIVKVSDNIEKEIDFFRSKLPKTKQ